MTTRKTAIASEYYFGNDTFGRRVELARRATDGQFFVRFGVGTGMSKWGKYNDPVKHTETIENAYTGEIVTLSAEESATLVEWGFKHLQAGSPEGLRLPLA